MKDKPQREISD